MRNPDTEYGRRPWNPLPQDLGYASPWEQQAAEAALRNDQPMPVWDDANRLRIRQESNPVNTNFFPDKFGYEDRAISIDDVSHLDDRFERRDFSGKLSGYAGGGLGGWVTGP